MSYSIVIALIVAVVLIVASGYCFLSALVQGRVESSGYVLTWKTNPVGMVMYLISVGACPVVLGGGLFMHWRGGSFETEMAPYSIYVKCPPGVRPELYYEGPGILRERAVTEHQNGNFHISYSAMSLPIGINWSLHAENDLIEYRVFDFVGVLTYCSDGTCRLAGEVWSQGRGELMVTGIDNKIALHPGRNDIALVWSE